MRIKQYEKQGLTDGYNLFPEAGKDTARTAIHLEIHRYMLSHPSETFMLDSDLFGSFEILGIDHVLCATNSRFSSAFCRIRNIR